MASDNKQSFSFRMSCAVFSIFCFITSLIVHIVSLLGFSFFNGFAGFLHIGAVLAVLLMIIHILNVPGGEIWKRSFFSERLIGAIPGKMGFVMAGFFIYMILGSIWFSVIREGVPSFTNGKYVLLSEGRTNNQKVVREITEAEYDLLITKEIKNLSTFWMFFYLIPTLYFWYSLKMETSQ
jgi:hypothetical protein